MTKILFIYWGRRGAMTKFTHDLATAAISRNEGSTHFSLSRQSENFPLFANINVPILAFDTFASSAGAVANLWRIPAIRGGLASYLTTHGIRTVIDLMPHVWSPLVASAVQRTGARYIATAHDALAHPGDQTALVKGWIDRTLSMADRVITLSDSVTASLNALGQVPHERIVTLFHPDMRYGPPIDRSGMLANRPLRFLFLGRIMPYKGLRLFVEATEKLRASGSKIEIGVFGAGDLGGLGQRLQALGAEVANRWLTDDDIADALKRYDVMVLSHIEASQSGVAATAFGAGMPVVCTPVGALIEQVTNGVTGLVAHEVTASALAGAMQRLTADRNLCLSLHREIQARAETRSMAHFLSACASLD